VSLNKRNLKRNNPQITPVESLGEGPQSGIQQGKRRLTQIKTKQKTYKNIIRRLRRLRQIFYNSKNNKKIYLQDLDYSQLLLSL